jgi:ABC-type multidrug transport system ATPase subunit
MLSIQGLTHVYANGTRALDNITLQIPKGMFGLLGPNGAGKSTLMRCLATLQIPSSGSVKFGDTDIVKNPMVLRRTLGYLPQDFGVYPRVSAEAMLDHLAILKGITRRAERKATIDALLHQVNLWDVRHKAIAAFSGGMRQRFGIAQALIGNPSLIIVDEPTAGLDPEERHRFLNLLSEIGENMVVILSSHIVEDVSNLCQRVAIIANGKIIAAGTPTDLINSLEGRLWRKVVDKKNIDAYKVRHEIITTRLQGGRTIIHVLADKLPAPGFEPLTGALEDVYFTALSSTRRAA